MSFLFFGFDGDVPLNGLLNTRLSLTTYHMFTIVDDNLYHILVAVMR